MTFATVHATMKRVGFGCFCLGALAAVGCANGTSPSVILSVRPGGDGVRRCYLSSCVFPAKRSSPGGEGVLAVRQHEWDVLHNHVLEPRCDRGRLEGRLCHREGFGNMDSDVVLDLPGPGDNSAFGDRTLTASVSRCTFSGGTGEFTHFRSTVVSRTRAGQTMAGTDVQLQSARLSRDWMTRATPPPVARTHDQCRHRRRDRP